jgi:hypothetical protein
METPLRPLVRRAACYIGAITMDYREGHENMKESFYI